MAGSTSEDPRGLPLGAGFSALLGGGWFWLQSAPLYAFCSDAQVGRGIRQ
jgi:hypothetical protein